MKQLFSDSDFAQKNSDLVYYPANMIVDIANTKVAPLLEQCMKMKDILDMVQLDAGCGSLNYYTTSELNTALQEFNKYLETINKGES